MTGCEKVKNPSVDDEKARELWICGDQKVQKDLIKMLQRKIDEVTANELEMKLLDSTGLNIMMNSVRKVRRELGFEAKSTGRTCQLISTENVMVEPDLFTSILSFGCC